MSAHTIFTTVMVMQFVTTSMVVLLAAAVLGTLVPMELCVQVNMCYNKHVSKQEDKELIAVYIRCSICMYNVSEKSRHLYIISESNVT